MTKQKKTMQDVGKKQNFEEKKENRRKRKLPGILKKRRKREQINMPWESLLPLL